MVNPLETFAGQLTKSVSYRSGPARRAVALEVLSTACCAHRNIRKIERSRLKGLKWDSDLEGHSRLSEIVTVRLDKYDFLRYAYTCCDCRTVLLSSHCLMLKLHWFDLL